MLPALIDNPKIIVVFACLIIVVGEFIIVVEVIRGTEIVGIGVFFVIIAGTRTGAASAVIVIIIAADKSLKEKIDHRSRKEKCGPKYSQNAESRKII